MKENKNNMSEIIWYLNSLITTINLELDMPVPEQHPCQKKSSELHNDQ